MLYGVRDNVPGFPGYYISKRGRLYSRRKSGRGLYYPGYHKKKWKLKKPRKGRKGLPRFYTLLCRGDGKTHRFEASRLVAMAWVPNPHNKPFVLHKDDNPQNNYYKNLCWGTHLENMAQMIERGRSCKGRKRPDIHQDGELNHMSKLTNLQRKEIILLRQGGEKIQKISERFQVGKSCIYHILRNKEKWLQEV